MASARVKVSFNRDMLTTSGQFPNWSLKVDSYLSRTSKGPV